MNIIKKTTVFLLLLILFVSCSNLFVESSETNNTGEVHITLNTNNSASQNAGGSRSAFPKTTVPSESETSVKVINSNGTENIKATVNSLGRDEYSISGIDFGVSFYIEVSVTFYSKKIYEGKTSLIKLSAADPVVSEAIQLKPLQTASGKGSVKLPLKSTATGLILYSYSIDGGKPSSKNSFSNGSADLSISDVPSGSHILKLSFWKGDYDNSILIYDIIDVINVYDNLETNKWINSGNSEWLQKDGEILKATITGTLAAGFEITNFYVDENKTNSTETGTFNNPYKSLQKAIDSIVNHGNTESEYVINLLSNITKETAAEGTLGNSYLRINSSYKRNITIQGYDGIKTIDAATKGRVLEINERDGTGSIIKLKNLELKNGLLNANTAVAKHGGGIYNTAVLELDNVKVIDCSVVSPSSGTSGAVRGGGIYNAGTLTINSGVISGCKVTASYTEKQAWGGGIYNISGKTCTLNSCIITGCIAEGKSGNKDANTPRGAGIYNGGTLTLGNSLDSGTPDVIIGTGTYAGTSYKTPNKCLNGSGGGVYSDEPGSLTMNSDCVIGTYNPGKCASVPEEEAPYTCGNYITGSAGAGLYCNTSSTVQINGGYISYNCGNVSSGNNTGVGLYLNSNMTCSVSNVEISYNYSNRPVFGAGFYSSGNYSFNNIKVFGNQVKTGATPSGIGAYLTQGCSISGKTWFDSSNDIYLKSGKKITVTSELTPENAAGVDQDTVASITYGGTASAGTVLLEASTSDLMASNVGKFKVLNDGGWVLAQNPTAGTEGILKQVIYVAGAGHRLPSPSGQGAGTKENPYSSLAYAISKIDVDDVLIYIDGELTESQGINIGRPLTISKYPSADKAKLTYTGNNVFITLLMANLLLNDLEIVGGSDSCRAIHVPGTYKVTLNNTSIHDFSGVDTGAGILLGTNSHAELTGTSSITNCSVSDKGAGICASGYLCTITFKDSAYLDEDCTVYIGAASAGMIRTEGVLTPPSTNKNITAYIKMSDYKTTAAILDGDSEENLTTNSSKFAVVPQGAYYYIFTSEGKLNKILENYNSSSMVIVRNQDDLVNNKTNILVNDIEMGQKQFRGTLIAPAGKNVTIYALSSTELFSSVTLGSADGGTITIDGSKFSGSGSGSVGLFNEGQSTIRNVVIKNFSSYFAIFSIRIYQYNTNWTIENVTVQDCPGSTAIYASATGGYDITLSLSNITIKNCNEGINSYANHKNSTIDIYTNTLPVMTGCGVKYKKGGSNSDNVKFYVNNVVTEFPTD